MFIITNGKIVTENSILTGYDLVLEGDKIKSIVQSGTLDLLKHHKVIDAKGGFVSPGFIDIHSDYIETMAAPRPNSLIDLNITLKETEKVLMNNGITTMYHSLSFYKDDCFGNKEIRKPENVRKFIELISESHDEEHLIRHRFHARFEIDNIDEIYALKEYIKEDKVHLISFMDHTPGQGQYRNLEIYKHTLKGYENLTDSDVDGIIEKQKSKERMTLDNIKEVVLLAREKNISVASHDDDTEFKLKVNKDLGINISEFPITMEVAAKAKKMGMSTIAGATNVLLGGSHSGNLSAQEAVSEGLIDVLCSDYYPASLLYSIFILNEKHNLDLCEMFKLVTLNPAKTVGMDGIIGSIEEGKKGDVLIIEKTKDNLPIITAVFVEGDLITRTKYRTDRGSW